MKNSINKNIKTVLIRFFICVFSVLLSAAFICSIELIGSRSQFSMTGKPYETVSFQELGDYLRDAFKSITI